MQKQGSYLLFLTLFLILIKSTPLYAEEKQSKK